MKSTTGFMQLSYGALLLLAGCAGVPQGTLKLAEVGPLAAAGNRTFASGKGYLTVYSATDVWNDGGYAYYRHTPYSLYTLEGRHVQGVANHVGPSDQRPMTVPLAPGKYSVFARSEGFGLVEVSVAIVAGRLTEVHLERSGTKSLTDLPEAECVRLPDGRVVGRRAPP